VAFFANGKLLKIDISGGPPANDMRVFTAAAVPGAATA
jgi:hypothetical protein